VMAKVLEAPTTPQKKNSSPPSPTAFTRFKAMTRKVVEPFRGPTARQNSGVDPGFEELGSRPGFDDHLFETVTLQEDVRSHQRSQGHSSRSQMVPTNTLNDADLGQESLHQSQSENFSQGNNGTTAGRKILKPKRDLSAAPGAPEKDIFGHPAPFSNFTNVATANSVVSDDSATFEPSPTTSRTRKISKGVSEVAESVSHAKSGLQGRQKPFFQSEKRVLANSAQSGAPLEAPKALVTSLLHPKPSSKKGNSSQGGQSVGGHQEQSVVGTRRISGLPGSNPSRLGHPAHSGSPGQSRVRAAPVQPHRSPGSGNFYAPLESSTALPPPPSPAPSVSSRRRQRESSDSEPDHTVKMRLLHRPDEPSANPQVDKLHASKHRASVSFAPPPLPAVQQAEDVAMDADSEGSISEALHKGEPAAPPPVTYAQAANGKVESHHAGTPTATVQPPSPSAKSHQVAVMLKDAEQLLTAALKLIDQATSMGGTLSPRLKQVLGNLGSTVIEEELLKKVGDLVELKLAAFTGAATVAPSAPASSGSKTVKSANPVPIQPTRATPLPPKPKPAPKSGAVRHHPARLIIQVFNPESCQHKPPVVAARDAANDGLERLGVAPRVAGVTYSAAGNIVAITRSPHTSQDLLPHALAIAQAILGEQVRCVGRQDVPWFRVQVNTVPVRYQGDIMTPEFVAHELRWALGDQNFLSPEMMAMNPRWMCSPSELAKKNHASVVFSFLKEEHARRFREAGAYLIYGKWCKTATYEDRPQVRYCANCWSMEHPSTGCRRHLPRCRLCAQNHNTEVHQCEDCEETQNGCTHIPLLCCNCKGNHAANSYDCPERKRKLGQFAKKTAAPVKQKPAVAASKPAVSADDPYGPWAPAPLGTTVDPWQTVQPTGGRKTKKGKSKAKSVPVPQPTPAPATVQQAQPGPSRTLRKVHSDPNLTPSRAGPSNHSQSWADQTEDMDIEVDAQAIFGIPVITGDDDAPDLV
jgi:hypothetical protein